MEWKEAALSVVRSITKTVGNSMLERTVEDLYSYANTRQTKKEKLKQLSNKNYDMSWQYNEVIVRNFVKRTFIYYNYGNKAEKVSIRKIRAEIEHQRLARNVLITGLAGAGKSTALKWLYINSNLKDCYSIYLNAKMFSECKTLQETLDAVEKKIAGKKRCLVFFDGLDELPCISGNEKEFEDFVDFFDKKSFLDSNGVICKFVVSTRPEHFNFHKMIRKKGTKKNLDNYIVYEIQSLTPKESWKVCVSIEKLSQFDKKNHYEHFIDKWPKSSIGRNSLSKRQYLGLLKRYLKSTSQEQSLLTSPLLCRYAYPIIREWNLIGPDQAQQTGYSQSARIEFALSAYLKWEFHDYNSLQTATGAGLDQLISYKKKTFAFLSKIAGSMGADQLISKTQWNSIKNRNRLIGNAAYCALCEYGDGKMAFIHQSFYDYFLACYYVKVSKRGMKDGTLSQFSHLLAFNSNFAVMYAEQLAQSGSTLAKKVCNYLLQGPAEKSFKKLSGYVKNKRTLMYHENIPFTVEEYFEVFPLGSVKYCSANFTLDSLNNLLSTGILWLENAENLEGFRAPLISPQTTY